MDKSRNNIRYQKLLAWLKQSRLEKNLSLRGLGERLCENHQLIDKIEKGERNLSVLEFVQYCEALELSPNEGIELLSDFEKFETFNSVKK